MCDLEEDSGGIAELLADRQVVRSSGVLHLTHWFERSGQEHPRQLTIARVVIEPAQNPEHFAVLLVGLGGLRVELVSEQLSELSEFRKRERVRPQ